MSNGIREESQESVMVISWCSMVLEKNHKNIHIARRIAYNGKYPWTGSNCMIGMYAYFCVCLFLITR